MTERNFPTIESQWQEFAAMIFHKTPVGVTQRAEMRKAFFAGVWAMLCINKRIGDSDVTEEQGMAWLTRIKDECIEFKEQMMKEYGESN